ncbi:hypothetical protein C5167_004436 [Papaver somniferum]|uniref:Uncharacterized protein n=1 Tax=Papaver somniferum TaxID=3469 RepID=A0A4Y7J7L0_PAPSO|nr:hypothetical protein C5167_004436 [Papaver somniferum]
MLSVDYQYSLFGTKEALGFNLHGCGSGVGPFLVLYPAGITSEVGVIHICLHYIKYKLINYAGTLENTKEKKDNCWELGHALVVLASTSLSRGESEIRSG